MELGSRWGVGEPRFATDDVVKWSQEIRKHGGAITWDVPVGAGGLIPQPFIQQLSAVGKALRGQAKEAVRSK
jgi:hypothetical protein